MSRDEGLETARGACSGEDRIGARRSKNMVVRKVIAVKGNYVVIRMSAGSLTQWDSSWSRERVCGRGGIRKNCGNLWKKVKSPRVNHPCSCSPVAPLSFSVAAEE
jgi:hypothetical protein